MPITIFRTKGTKYVFTLQEVERLIIQSLKDDGEELVSLNPRITYEINDQYQLVSVVVYDQTSCPTCGRE